MKEAKITAPILIKAGDIRIRINGNTPPVDCRILAEEAYQNLLDALLFSYGAILDAISLKDGLDKATGETVIKMITEQLDKHGVSYK